VYITYERSIYRSTIDRKVVLLRPKVDNIAAAYSDPIKAQGLSEFIPAVLVANITKYLRPILIELGLPPSGQMSVVDPHISVPERRLVTSNPRGRDIISEYRRC
jgi:hypothetical protein